MCVCVRLFRHRRKGKRRRTHAPPIGRRVGRRVAKKILFTKVIHGDQRGGRKKKQQFRSSRNCIVHYYFFSFFLFPFFFFSFSFFFFSFSFFLSFQIYPKYEEQRVNAIYDLLNSLWHATLAQFIAALLSGIYPT